MAKIDPLADVGSLANTTSARATINANSDRIEEAFENTLSRDGSSPNQMEADIDLNDHFLLNVADPVNEADAVNLRSVRPLVEAFASSIVETAVFGTQIVDTYAAASAGQTVFTLSQPPGSIANVEFFVAGVAKRPGIDFTLSGASLQTLTLTTPLAGGELAFARYTKALPSGITEGAAVMYTPPSTLVSGTVKSFLDSLWSTGANAGAKLIRWIQGYSGAVARTQEAKNRDVVSVKDFGAVGDGVTDDSAAIIAAITALQSASSERGRRLKLPAGHYMCPTPLDLTSFSLIHGIVVEGEGETNTILDFAGTSASQDGITFGTGAHFGLKGLFIANAGRDGVVIGRGHTTGGPDYCSFFTLEDLRIQASGRDGLLVQNAYLGTLRNIWARDSGRNGINLAGFHTALTVDSCEASDNDAAGWVINGAVYSTFQACGSDGNGTYGYAISNMQGCTMNACGAESNQRDGFLLFTSTASATGLNAQSSDIRGVEFIGCYGLANSLASVGTYATFMGINTADSRAASVAVRGGIAHPSNAGDRAFILAGASGAIVVAKDGFDDAAFSTADSLTGTVEIQNRLVRGRRCLVQTTGAQSIPDAGVDTTINVLNTTPVVNDLGATVSTTTITIPKGVSKVVVGAGMGWENDGSTGQRTVKVFKNGAGFVGMPNDQRAAQTFTLSNIKSAVVSVAQGDTFSLVVSQTSGAARNTLGTSNAVWLSVEAIG